jgi:hypothetical protein
MIRLLEQSVKIQQQLLQKDVSFTAILNNKSSPTTQVSLSQQSRAKL